MKTFKVYQHPIAGYEAVKVGFSWPAFFFSWIWMLVKKLWALAGLWFVLYLVLSIIEAAADEAGSEPELQSILYLILAGGYFALVIVAGYNGNGWRQSNLEKRGFEVVQEVEAKTPDAATASAAKSSSGQQQEGA